MHRSIVLCACHSKPLFSSHIELLFSPRNTHTRRHPAISAFPSAAFYKGRLRDAVAPSTRPLPAGFDWPSSTTPVAFVQCDGPEEPSGPAGATYQNTTEAAAAAAAVRALIEEGGARAEEVCVITPYSGQARLLKQMLVGGGGGGDSGSGSSGSTSGRQVVSLEGLEIKTVDGFQGREKEVVVFSAVRSSTEGSVGFLSDCRRLNVAITRPRRGLIVLGDARTLARDPVWRAWLQWAREVGAFVAAPPPASARDNAAAAAAAAARGAESDDPAFWSSLAKAFCDF